MTHPGALGAQMPPGDDWIGRQLRDLQRQLDELSAGRSGEASAITAGATVVNDESNVERVRLGNLDLDGYGLKLTNQGVLLVFDASNVERVRVGGLGGSDYGLTVTDENGQVAAVRPPAVATKASTQTVDATSGVVWNATPGPSMVVDTNSGRIPFVVSVNAATSGSADQLAVAVEVLLGGTVVIAPTTAAGGLWGVARAAGEVSTLSFGGVIVVPAAGAYTVRLRYFTRGSPGTGQSDISSANITMFPT